MSRAHVVREGECLSSIAYDYGFEPETLWNDAENEKLRAERPSFNLLVPGDVVMVPERRVREERCATGQRYRFKRKGVPEKFRVRIVDEDLPRAGAAYRLTFDDRLEFSGKTDDDGWIGHFIPPDAHRGRLVVLDEEPDDDGLSEQVMEFELGALTPIAIGDGTRDRLISLGYLDEEEESDDALADAVREFQSDHELDRSGEIDDATRDAIEKAYGT